MAWQTAHLLSIALIASQLVLVSGGCDKGEPTSPTPAPATEPAKESSTPPAASTVDTTSPPSKAVEDTQAKAAEKTAAAPDEKQPCTPERQKAYLAALPPRIDFAPAHKEKLKAARTLNGQAIKLSREGKPADAIPIFTQALITDPGYLTSWYNLASMHARLEQGCEALAILGLIAEVNGRVEHCAWCARRLISARDSDPDFASVRGTPELAALTDGITIEQPSLASAARALDKAVHGDKKAREKLYPFVNPRGTFRHHDHPAYYEESDKAEKTAYVGRKGFDDWLETYEQARERRRKCREDDDDEGVCDWNYIFHRAIKCDAKTNKDGRRCCDYHVPEDEDHDGVRKGSSFGPICFKESKGVLTLKAVHEHNVSHP